MEAASHGKPAKQPRPDLHLGYIIAPPCKKEAADEAADDSLAAKRRAADIACAELIAEEEGAMPLKSAAATPNRKSGNRRKAKAKAKAPC